MKVKFLYHDENDDLFAFFPDEIEDIQGNRMSYAHIGQHSTCSVEYAEECRNAKRHEYKELLTELKSIGYTDLQIVK